MNAPEVATAVAPTLSQTAATELRAWGEMMRAALQSATEVGKEQIPLVLQEVVKWRIVGSGLWAMFFLLLTTGLVYMSYLGFTWKRKNPYEDWEVLGIICGLLAIFTTALIFGFTSDLLQAWLTPRAYLIDYIARLVK